MQVFDDYLDTSGELAQAFLDEDVWIDLHNDDSKENHTINWWDGSSKPKNIWEQMILKLWEKKPAGIEGYEYWANCLQSGDTLPWHQDKDEGIYETSHETVCPSLSSVFYGYPHKIEGGFLELATSGSVNLTTERIKPIYNRLVTFNPAIWHRVSPVEKGVRYALQVNLWKNKPTESTDKEKY